MNVIGNKMKASCAFVAIVMMLAVPLIVIDSDVNAADIEGDDYSFYFYNEPGSGSGWMPTVKDTNAFSAFLKSFDLGGKAVVASPTWITSIDGLTSTYTDAVTDYCGYAIFYWDESAASPGWVYSNGLNENEGHVYFITYANYDIVLEFGEGSTETADDYYEIFFGSGYIHLPTADEGANIDDISGKPAYAAPAISTPDKEVISSTNVSMTYMLADGITATNFNNYTANVWYDTSALELVSISDFAGTTYTAGAAANTMTPNLSVPGKITFAGESASGADASAGLFTIVFKVIGDAGETTNVYATANDLVQNSANVEGCNADLKTVDLTVLTITEASNMVSAGDTVTVNGSTIDRGDYVFNSVVTYDDAVFDYAGIVASLHEGYGEYDTIDTTVICNDGTIRISSYNVVDYTLTFRIVDNPVPGTSSISVDGTQSPVNVNAKSFLIMPELNGNSTTVSFLDVPDISGFDLKYDYTGTAPAVELLFSGVGMVTTDVDVFNHILSVVWVSDDINRDMNGQLFKVTGVSALTLRSYDIVATNGADEENVYVSQFASEAAAKNQTAVAGTVSAGDVDGDGENSLMDLVILMRYLDGQIALSSGALLNADYNEDGNISILDAMGLSGELVTAE